ncbi:IPT/TIG domain-containing protein [Nitrosophilus labii]|uniref:IPT/TIG domain-containing protein n=1 Tax=Nitrosophilus labii TaxID=2706014 RepID=UPI0016575F9D|nr:IPT/TIG domain-containing protein [Nitrosophilus labii]
MKIFNLIVTIALSFLLLGCGGSSEQTSDTTSTTISGSTYKGIVQNAVVNVYDFSNNSKGKLISTSVVEDSKFTVSNINGSTPILIEITKNTDNTTYYIDETNGKKVGFNDLVLKTIINNPTEKYEYFITPLTTLATEMLINGKFSDFDTAQSTISKLFGLSFDSLSLTKPNIEGIETDSEKTKENEYAISILSMVAYQNEINKIVGTQFTFKDLLELIVKDLSDGIFDGKDGNESLIISDGNLTFAVGDLPKKLSQAGQDSLSIKNPLLFENMKDYFLRAATAARVIEPPIIDIKYSENIRLNEKSLLSADGSYSYFGYPLTYAWSIKSSPTNSNAVLSNKNDANTFITVDTEGNYVISLEISDGHNKVSKDINITADLDGDGLLSYEDLDVDGDGILNENDLFPNNPAEFLDDDGNGIGNFAQEDEDGDGVVDTEDDYPFDENRSIITTINETEFNGNLNDANVLSGSLPLKVSGTVYFDSGTDDDYFKFDSVAGTIVSMVLKKSNTDFEPIVSIVDSSGNSLVAINNINYANNTVVTFRIPTDGTYAFIITDKNNYSDTNNTYEAKIFVDSDMDGVADDFERAIGCNEKSSDSDGDGIKDFYEIYTSSFDIDGDGIPNWLDIDSDGDTILDANEALVDYDNDGLLNPYDTDSDGNGISDDSEIGTNHINPLDTDGDGYADYMDVDDDNDGILDINDNNRLTSEDINSSATIYIEGNINSVKIPNFAQTGGVLNITGENFDQNAIVLLIEQNGVHNLVPTEINSTNITVTLPKIIGQAIVRVYNNDYLTASDNLNIVEATSPVLYEVVYPNTQQYALDGDTVTLNGVNLSNIASVKVNDIEIKTFYATNTSVSFDVNSSISSGTVKVTTLNGESNELPIFIGKTINGKVVLPQGSSYNYSDLKVDFAGIEYNINDDGNFTMVIRNRGSSSITVFTPEDASGTSAYYLSALVFSDDNASIIVDTNSTAIDIMFSAFNAGVADIDTQKKIYDIIKNNIDAFAKNLAENLGNNPYYIMEASQEYIDALATSKSLIQEQLEKESIFTTISIQSIKVNEIDGFSVYKTGDPIDGKILIENDTMVFADFMITDSATGKIIRDYVNEFYNDGLLSPQDSTFFLYRAYKATYDVKYRSCKVNIKTPKFEGMTLSNFNKLPEYKLAIRTLISQGIFPIISTAIGINIDNKAQSVLLDYVIIPALNGNAIDYWQEGKVGDGFSKFVEDIIKIIAKDDDVQKALIKVLGWDKKFFGKIATKLIAKTATKGFQVAATAVDLGLTVLDFATIKDEIEFIVNFPIEITDIYPTSVKKDGFSKTIYLEGRGLDNYCSEYEKEWISYLPPRYINVCKTWHYPTVTIKSGNDIIDLDLHKEDESLYYFEIPSDFLENATEDINVTVTHVHNDEQWIDELINITVAAPKTISIVDKLSISKITPDSGGSGTIVVISGAGFSTNLLDNKVYFTTNDGTTLATVIDATESELTVQVPKGVVTGDVWVSVDNEESNRLTFTVSTTKVTIEFGDNGSLTDDTFSLDFDNGKVIKTMPYPMVTDSVTVEMEPDVIYTVKLIGITAPDAIGTYYISFPSEVEVLPNSDELSGYDLTAGVVKTFYIRLNSATSTVNIVNTFNQSINYVPLKQIIIQPETR